MDQDPLLRVSDNDKPGSRDEDAERVECSLKISNRYFSYLVSICFTQPATADLATALYGFMKLTNN